MVFDIIWMIDDNLRIETTILKLPLVQPDQNRH